MENVVVAVSGGSDSLALLDILYKQNKYNLICAHVNYNYRDTSLRDENIVREYTKKNNIKLYVLNLESRKEIYDNFEDWARVKRYEFFKSVYDKEKCSLLIVGHNQDDHIETYLMQKDRNSIVEYYGIRKETIILGMNVYRPLLDYTKKELEGYCKDNKLEYGIDETNFDTSYSRNKIRANVINKLNIVERKNILSDIEKLNVENSNRDNKMKEIFNKICKDNNSIMIYDFNLLSEDEKIEVLYRLIINNVYKRISIRKARLLDIIKKIESNKPNILLAEYNEYKLYKEYERIVIVKDSLDYKFEIYDETKKELDNGFYISDNGFKLEKVIVSKDRFPLYITNYKGDNKDVNRIFIDKKIPLRKRKSWPIIIDKFGALLLVINIKKFYNEVCGLNDKNIEIYIRKKGE